MVKHLRDINSTQCCVQYCQIRVTIMLYSNIIVKVFKLETSLNQTKSKNFVNFTYCAEGFLHITLLQQESVVVANDQPIEVRRGCHRTSKRRTETYH